MRDASGLRQRRTQGPSAAAAELPLPPAAQAKRALGFGEISLTGKVALVLLALQFASEPHFREVSHRAAAGGGANGKSHAAYNPMSAVAVTELLKIVLCTGVLALGSGRQGAGAQGAAASGVHAKGAGTSRGRLGFGGGHLWLIATVSLLYALQDWCAAQCVSALHAARVPLQTEAHRGSRDLAPWPTRARPCPSRCVDYASRPGSGCSPLLFQLLNQTKTVWAAMLMRLFMGMKRSRVQWCALCILTVSSAVIATKPAEAYMARAHSSGARALAAGSGLGSGTRSEKEGGRGPQSGSGSLLGVPLGVWATIASALLSGANQAITEISLRAGAGASSRPPAPQPERGRTRSESAKGRGSGNGNGNGNGHGPEAAEAQPQRAHPAHAQPQRRDPAAFSRDMAIFKLMFALLAGAAAMPPSTAEGSDAPQTPVAALTRAAEMFGQFWRGWRPITIVPCALSACGGILVGQVTALAGGDWKGYALVGGVVCSALYSHVARAEAVAPDTSLAALLIVVSMTLYVRYPVVEPQDGQGSARQAPRALLQRAR